MSVAPEIGFDGHRLGPTPRNVHTRSRRLSASHPWNVVSAQNKSLVLQNKSQRTRVD